MVAGGGGGWGRGNMKKKIVIEEINFVGENGVFVFVLFW